MSINGTGKYELWFLILAIYISILCLIVIGVLSVKVKHNEELVGKMIGSSVSIIEITRIAGIEHIAARLGAVRAVDRIAVIGGEDVVGEL
ncbi:MAG: hypothetical protein HFE34_06210, partial [Clostridia bacterium]|nr:hypothetical protein [Clostridia bacterium]